MKPLPATPLLRSLPRETLHAIVRSVLLYAVFAAAWIMLSDSAVGWLFGSPDDLALANTLKGLGFVAVTSLLLFFLLLRFAAGRDDAGSAKVGAGGTPPPGGDTVSRSDRRKLIVSIVLFSAVFAALGGGGMQRDWQRHRADAAEQLQAIARLKVAQIESWLGERRRDARVLRTAPLFNEGLAEWRRSGDPALRARMEARLKEFVDALDYQGVAICDERGELLLQAGAAGHGNSEALRATVRRALAEDRILMTDLYRMSDPPPGHVHLEFVAPIKSETGAASSKAAVVLRVDVARTLHAFLQTWPVPSATAETLLFRRDGDDVLYLNELRHRTDTALKLRLPLSADRVLAVQALAPGYRPGDLLEGVDYRGVPVLGVALPVPGVDWWLVAKVDREEVFGEARRGVLWIAFASLLTWGVAVGFAVLLLQWRELRHERRQRAEQAAKLQALRLLEALASSSHDIIYAKDREGRFILFNKAAEELTGRSAQDVLGRDEWAIFPPAVAERQLAAERRVRAEGRIITFEDRIPMPDGERVFLTTKGPLIDADGQVIGIYGIAHEITERARIEAALRRNNEELERFNRAMVGRELDMVELKRRINALSRELGREAPFDLTQLDAAGRP